MTPISLKQPLKNTCFARVLPRLRRSSIHAIDYQRVTVLRFRQRVALAGLNFWIGVIRK